MAGRRRTVGQLVGAVLRAIGYRDVPRLVKKSNRAASVDVDRYRALTGVGQDWARTVYGDYYATSVPVYSAIKTRSEALSRPRVTVIRGHEPVEKSHPVQQLLDGVNKSYSRGELWRATEIYLCLWGSAFWALERNDLGR